MQYYLAYCAIILPPFFPTAPIVVLYLTSAFHCLVLLRGSGIDWQLRLRVSDGKGATKGSCPQDRRRSRSPGQHGPKGHAQMQQNFSLSSLFQGSLCSITQNGNNSQLLIY